MFSVMVYQDIDACRKLKLEGKCCNEDGHLFVVFAYIKMSVIQIIYKCEFLELVNITGLFMMIKLPNKILPLNKNVVEVATFYPFNDMLCGHVLTVVYLAFTLPVVPSLISFI